MTGTGGARFGNCCSKEFGLPKEEAQQLFYRYQFRWRGTDRECELSMPMCASRPFDTFKNKAEQWRVIIDFPFDQTPHGPRSDLSRLQQFRNENEEGYRTIRLDSFVPKPRRFEELGRLVILDHILTGERFDQYVSHLSPADKASAKGLARNQQKQLRAKMVAHLQAVYSAGAVWEIQPTQRSSWNRASNSNASTKRGTFSLR